MHARRLTALGAGIVLSLTGCPSDPSTPSDVPLADLPPYLAGAVCDLYAACNPLVGTVYGTGAECEAQLVARFEDGEIHALEHAVEDGTIVYHGDLVGDCVDALGAAGCDIGDPFDSCESIFEGTVADGGACEHNEECGAGSWCAITTACPGVCQARVASGGACTTGNACQAGLSCNSGTCGAPATAGAACNGTTGVSCQGLAYACVGDDGTTAGVCTAYDSLFVGIVGEPCDPTNEDFCDPALSCAFDGITGGMPTFRCVARVTGGACTIAIPDQCPDGQFCAGVDFTMGVTEGTCMPLPVAGEDCTPAVPFPRCASGNVCINTGAGPGTCELLGRIGATCTADQACASGYCMGGTCVEGETSVCR